jgi:hypothetical protein
MRRLMVVLLCLSALVGTGASLGPVAIAQDAPPGVRCA